MATHTTTTDYAHEKQEVQYVEHARDSPTDSSHELQKERTLEGIDMANSYAIKGDDSDGKVTWSVRSIFAAIFLAALYTGTLASISSSNHPVLIIIRLPSHSLLHWRIPWFHRRRPRTLTWLCMAPNSQHSRYRCGMPLCWLPPGSLRQALHRFIRFAVHLHWLCPGRIRA